MNGMASGSGPRCVRYRKKTRVTLALTLPSAPSRPFAPSRFRLLSHTLLGSSTYSGQPQRPLNPTQSWAQAQSQMIVKEEPFSSNTYNATAPPAGASGIRSEPPRRAIEIDDLTVGHPGINELVTDTKCALPSCSVAATDLYPPTSRTTLLLQGDAQVITKQRVETAIRVILDLIRQVPSSFTPSLHPSLQHLIQPGLGLPVTLERVGTFRSIKLQKGTTTKASPKKLLAQGETPREETLWLETAVFMSGGEKRVYACKRCRAREVSEQPANDDADAL